MNDSQNSSGDQPEKRKSPQRPRKSSRPGSSEGQKPDQERYVRRGFRKSGRSGRADSSERGGRVRDSGSQKEPAPGQRGRAEGFAVRIGRTAEGAPGEALKRAGAADGKIVALQAVPLPADRARAEVPGVQTLNTETRQVYGGGRNAPPEGIKMPVGVQLRADCQTGSPRGSIWKRRYD